MKDFGLTVKCSGKLLMSLEWWVDKVWPYMAMKWSRARVEAERPGQGSFHRTAKWPWLDSEWQGSGERGKFCTGFVHRTSRIS